MPPEGSVPAVPNDPDDPARSAAGVRLHDRGHSVLPRTDGAGRRRPGRLDGHRHADRGALGPAEAALQLLQAEFRAGHQPADRPDPRGIGDVADLDDRAAAEPARPRSRHTPPARSRAADPDRRRAGENPQYRASGRRRASRPIRSTSPGRPRGRGRHRAGARPAVCRGDCGGRGRAQHPDPVGPRGFGRAGADPGAARDLGGAPSPDPPRPAHQDRHRRRDRRGARGASFLRAGRLRRRGDQSVSRLRDAWSRSAPKTACRCRRNRSRRTT